MFTWLTWKEESHISSMFIFLVIGFLLIVVPGALVTLNLQHSYQEYYYPNNDQQNALYDYLFRNNSSLISRYNDSLNYPEDGTVAFKNYRNSYNYQQYPGEDGSGIGRRTWQACRERWSDKSD